MFRYALLSIYWYWFGYVLYKQYKRTIENQTVD